jgi:hypothetical protein
MEEGIIIGVWDVFKEYIPEKNKETAANHFVDFLIGNDIEQTVLESLSGYDQYLDDAIAVALEDVQEASYDDEDDIDYYEDED